MRVLIAGAMVLLMAGAAFAQAPGLNLGAFEQKKDPLKQQKEEEIDRAYRDATQGGKAAAPSPNDPWGAVRAAEQPAARPQKKPAAKPKVQAQTHAHPQAQAKTQAQSPWPAPPKPQAQAQSPWPAPQPQAQAQSPWPATPR